MRAIWFGVVMTVFLSHVFALADHDIASLSMKKRNSATVDLGGVAVRHSVNPKNFVNEQVGAFNLGPQNGSGKKIKFRFRTHAEKRNQN